ncbi:MAG: type II secretion system F family protein [Anaerococcus sp.]|nr:type II secretion system F family protein [Anaerococcus sp.]
MSLFLKQLSLLLNAGVSLDQSLVIIKDQGMDKRLGKSLARVLASLDRGKSIYEAFNKEVKAFGPTLVAFVRSGDESGKLAGILESYADFLDFDSKNKAQIKQAFIYPIILLIVTVFVISLLMTLVIPSFIVTFDNAQMALPLTTRILIDISNIFSNYGGLFLAFLTLIIIIVFILYKKETYRLVLDTYLFSLPFFRNFRRLNIEYQITSLLYILRSGDINIIDCIEIIKKSFKNHYLKEVSDQMVIDLKSGHSLSESLARRGIFSNLLVSMVKVGEDSGNLVESLAKASDYYSNEYIYKLKKFSRLAEPALILVMSLVVGFVVFSITIPMFDSINYI